MPSYLPALDRRMYMINPTPSRIAICEEGRVQMERPRYSDP